MFLFSQESRKDDMQRACVNQGQTQGVCVSQL